MIRLDFLTSCKLHLEKKIPSTICMGMYILTIIVITYILVVREYLGIRVPLEVLTTQMPHNYPYLNEKAKVSPS